MRPCTTDSKFRSGPPQANDQRTNFLFNSAWRPAVLVRATTAVTSSAVGQPPVSPRSALCTSDVLSRERPGTNSSSLKLHCFRVRYLRGVCTASGLALSGRSCSECSLVATGHALLCSLRRPLLSGELRELKALCVAFSCDVPQKALLPCQMVAICRSRSMV